MPTCFVKRILLQNAFLDFSPSGSYPWGRVDAPQRSGGVWKYFQNVIWINANRFCKKNFALKCIPGPVHWGPTPGAGWTPPRGPVGSGSGWYEPFSNPEPLLHGSGYPLPLFSSAWLQVIGSLLKFRMKTTSRLMALVWLVELLDLIRVRVPKDKVQKSLTIPHNTT